MPAPSCPRPTSSPSLFVCVCARVRVCAYVSLQDVGGGEKTLMEVMFKRDRSFKGRGLAARTRRVYQQFDDNDSGSISFEEFFEVLRGLGFFPFNVEVHGRKMQLVERSLLCCDVKAPARRACISVAYSKVFDNVLVGIIVCNTIVIAMEDQGDPALAQVDPTLYSALNQFVYTSDFWFSAL
jgi:hypothetical protein